MMYHIRTFGDPVLRMKAKPLFKFDQKLKNLINDMFEIMYQAPGLGLAAPQIGISQRIIVFDTGEVKEALINPEIIKSENFTECEEGCLSIPNRQRVIDRAQNLKVAAFNQEGEKVVFEFEGLAAQVVQHEIDHLDGKLICDQGKPLIKKEASD